jgi:predicted metal-dependent phosphoesterase TrpH
MALQFVADLHNHTVASDGEYTPEELILKARELGLQAVGVTDHDTLAGLDNALAAGEKAGIMVIPGVEVSLRFRRPFFVGTLHYLLYIPRDLLQDQDFRNRATEIFAQGRGAGLVRARVQAINDQFGPQGCEPLLARDLTVEEVEALASNVTRRHFAQALAENHGLSKAQVSLLIGNDSLAYVPSGIDPAQLTPLLQEYPQLVRVFAHPAAGSFPRESLYSEVLPPIEVVEKLLPEFLNDELLGLDGLEVYYPGHAQLHRDIVSLWATEHDLIETGGSDCHDPVDRPLGVCGVDAERLAILLNLLGDNVPAQ